MGAEAKPYDASSPDGWGRTESSGGGQPQRIGTFEHGRFARRTGTLSHDFACCCCCPPSGLHARR